MNILKIVSIDNMIYYVIMPVFLLVMQWIKKWRDTKRKNKNSSLWKVNYRVRRPFWEVSLIFIFVISLIILPFSILSELWNNIYYKIFLQVLCFVIYIFIFKLMKKITIVRIEFLKCKAGKMFMLLVLGVIMPLPITYSSRLDVISIWLPLVLGWCSLIYFGSDRIITYDMTYANIYICGEEPIKYVMVDDIEKHGSWISVAKYGKNGYQEIKIKENQIERIDYFGDPLLVVENVNL